MLLFLNVIYVLIAIAMIALILMQRGAGAQAGSGFGAGASGTVFGSRGASNFLSKSTKWLAVAFFVISLFMAWNAGHSSGAGAAATTQEKGLMSQVPAAPASGGATVPAAPAPVPAAPTSTPPASTAPAAPASSAPSAPPANPEPATQQQPVPAQPSSGG
jgi:preprotein translocase subunit SecG